MLATTIRKGSVAAALQAIRCTGPSRFFHQHDHTAGDRVWRPQRSARGRPDLRV